jgi:hypothetical protein
MNQRFFENSVKTRQDKNLWSVFPVWVGTVVTHRVEGRQFEILGHAGECFDQELVDGEGQQQGSMTIDVMETSEEALKK